MTKRSAVAVVFVLVACSNDNSPQKSLDGGAGGASSKDGGVASGGRANGAGGGSAGSAAKAGATGSGGGSSGASGSGGASGANGNGGARPNEGGGPPDASDRADASEPSDAGAPDAEGPESGVPQPGETHIRRWLLYTINYPSLLDVSAFPLPMPIQLPQGYRSWVWSPDGKYLAYVGTSGQGLLLDMSGPTVGTPTNIAASGSTDTLSFSWAPSSRILATNRAGTIAVLDPSDAAPIPGNVDTSVLQYGFLPDSSGLAYVADRASSRDVMVAKINGFAVSSSKKVASTTDPYFAFAVSPVRDEFAYLFGDTLSLVRTSGGVPQSPSQVSLGTQGTPMVLRFSADGNWLLAHMETNSTVTAGLPDDVLVDVRGAALGTPRSLRTLLNIDNIYTDFLFSPNGKWVTLGTGNTSTPCNGFSVVDLSGGTPSGASACFGNSIADFVWSSASTSLVLLKEYGQQVTLQLTDLKVPDSRNTLTTETMGGYSLGYSPDGRVLAYTVNRALGTRTISGTTLGDLNAVDTNVTNLSWSPASDKLAYTKLPDVGTKRKLFIVRMVGASPSAPIPIELSTIDNYDAQCFWQP